MNNNTSIVLLSGGLDSSLSLLHAREQTTIAAVVTFDYGQKCRHKEIIAAKNICECFGLNHKTMSLPFFDDLNSHPFFNSAINCPQPSKIELDDKTAAHKSAKAVWVPNRNGLFLNVAASLAEMNSVRYLYVGFNAEEATTFPDNSQDFVTAINKSFAYSTMNQVEVRAPTITMNKTTIVKELLARDFPIPMIWSCYNDGEKMCGRCESCMRLKRAALANDTLDLLPFDIGHWTSADTRQ